MTSPLQPRGSLERPLRQFAILNSQTIFPAKTVREWVEACQIQIDRDVVPTWDAIAKLTYYGRGATIPRGAAWVVALVNDADASDALGYHDVTADGAPMGKVFIRTAMEYDEEPSVVLSHEILEMMGDPFIAQVVIDGLDPVKFWAREVCDPCQANSYEITVKSGNKVKVSDFVMPIYFNSAFKGLKGVKWSFTGSVKGPIPALAPGGYLPFVKNGVWDQAVRAKRGEKNGKLASKAQRLDGPLDKRRLLRLLPREKWIRNDAVTVKAKSGTTRGAKNGN